MWLGGVMWRGVLRQVWCLFLGGMRALTRCPTAPAHAAHWGTTTCVPSPSCSTCSTASDAQPSPQCGESSGVACSAASSSGRPLRSANWLLCVHGWQDEGRMGASRPVGKGHRELLACRV